MPESHESKGGFFNLEHYLRDHERRMSTPERPLPVRGESLDPEPMDQSNADPTQREYAPSKEVRESRRSRLRRQFSLRSKPPPPPPPPRHFKTKKPKYAFRGSKKKLRDSDTILAKRERKLCEEDMRRLRANETFYVPIMDLSDALRAPDPARARRVHKQRPRRQRRRLFYVSKPSTNINRKNLPSCCIASGPGSPRPRIRACPGRGSTSAATASRPSRSTSPMSHRRRVHATTTRILAPE